VKGGDVGLDGFHGSLVGWQEAAEDVANDDREEEGIPKE
jgi:hypothetical protein